MSVGLCTGSGVNFVAVLAPGIFFSKKQGGCDFVPQLPQPGFRGLLSLQPCWRWVSMLPSWMGERASRLPASLHQSQGFLGWQVDKAPPGSGHFFPFQCPGTPVQCLVCGTLKTSSSG